MYLYLCFHRGAKKGKKRFLAGIVKACTFGWASHVEIRFPDEVLTEENVGKNCFSSTQMDEPKGVRFKNIKFSHIERWVFVRLSFPLEIIIKLYNGAIKHVGQKYDYAGAVSTSPFIKLFNSKKRWYCSEICSHVLFISPEDNSPTKLFRMVKRIFKGIKIFDGRKIKVLPWEVE